MLVKKPYRYGKPINLIRVIVLFVLTWVSCFSSIAADLPKHKVLYPMYGFNIVLETHRLIGYFVPSKGKCELILLISEDWDPEDIVTYRIPVRIFHNIAPGHKALINTPEAVALEFTCEGDAQWMSVRKQGGNRDNKQLAGASPL